MTQISYKGNLKHIKNINNNSDHFFNKFSYKKISDFWKKLPLVNTSEKKVKIMDELKELT